MEQLSISWPKQAEPERKACGKCGGTEFYIKRRGRGTCANCERARSRARYAEKRNELRDKSREWRKRNRPLVLAQKARYRKKHAEKIKKLRKIKYEENREAFLAYLKKSHLKHKAKRNLKSNEYYRKNKSAISALRRDRYNGNRLKFRVSARGYYLKNSDRVKSASLAWARANRDRRRLHERDRSARKRGNGRGSITTALWRDRLDEFDNRCAYCLIKSDKLTMDHIIALSRGGEHSIDNIVPACVSCNSTKSAKPIFMMALEI